MAMVIRDPSGLLVCHVRAAMEWGMALSRRTTASLAAIFDSGYDNMERTADENPSSVVMLTFFLVFRKFKESLFL